MAKCIRCGKPCGSGENMCDECKAWFQEKTGGSVVSGVKNITSKPNKEVQADSKEQNNEQEKEKQVEVNDIVQLPGFYILYPIPSFPDDMVAAYHKVS